MLSSYVNMALSPQTGSTPPQSFPEVSEDVSEDRPNDYGLLWLNSFAIEPYPGLFPSSLIISISTVTFVSNNSGSKLIVFLMGFCSKSLMELCSRVSHMKGRPLVSSQSGGSHISTCTSFSGFHFPFLLLDPTFRRFPCATKFPMLNLASTLSLGLART